MNYFSFSQTEPISSLPRNYAALLQRAKTKKEPVIFLKRNRPVAALLDWDFLQKIIEFKTKLEEEETLRNIFQSEKEFEQGKAKLLKSLALLKQS